MNKWDLKFEVYVVKLSIVFEETYRIHLDSGIDLKWRGNSIFWKVGNHLQHRMESQSTPNFVRLCTLIVKLGFLNYNKPEW